MVRAGFGPCKFFFLFLHIFPSTKVHFIVVIEWKLRDRLSDFILNLLIMALDTYSILE